MAQIQAVPSWHGLNRHHPVTLHSTGKVSTGDDYVNGIYPWQIPFFRIKPAQPYGQKMFPNNSASAKDANILVVRNDKLGDFMLSWPALSQLKRQYPQCTVSVLIPLYTKPVALLCPWIDNIIIDNKTTSTVSDCLKLIKVFRENNFDAIVTLFSTTRIGLAAWLARIPVRVAPATKLAQIFYNQKLVQRRSRSEKPEYAYNIDLVNYFIKLNGDLPVEIAGAPYLEFEPNEIKTAKAKRLTDYKKPAETKLVFIHPGTGGSANNLSPEQYAQLTKLLATNTGLYFVITAGPGELDIARRVSQLLPETSHSLHHSTSGLAEFAKFIAICDLFISGSTGPLHIAGALNVCTAAFYPARRSATSLRWETTNDEKNRLSFMPDNEETESAMQTIDMNVCSQKITETFFT